MNKNKKDRSASHDASGFTIHIDKKRFAAGCFFPLAILYYECLLRIGRGASVTERGFFPMVFFSLCLGIVLTAFCMFFNSEKSVHTVTVVLTAITLFYYGVEYFCLGAFKVYFNVKSLLTGGGGIVGEFGSVIIDTIVHGWLPILFLFLPLIFVLLFGKKLLTPQLAGKNRTGSIVKCFVLSTLTFLIAVVPVWCTKDFSDKYTAHYEYNTSVKTFGLATATRLDFKHAVLKDLSSSQFSTANASSLNDSDADEAVLSEKNIVTAEAGPDILTSAPVVKKPVVYDDNVMDIDFEALAEESESESIAALHHYVASQTPTKLNEYTGLFEGKNLILITAEALSLEAIREDTTPTLYRMLKKGINVEEYYQPSWGGSTSTGEYSVLTGLVPVDAVSSMDNTIGNNLYLTLGNQLQRLGYQSQAYHDGYEYYYNRENTHTNFGYSKFEGIETLSEKGLVEQWPESDLEMMQVTVGDYINAEHFSTYYMSISGHCCYNDYGNAMSVKNLPEISVLPSMEDVPLTIQAYYACQAELDKALEYLIGELDKAGKTDDTVIVITSDHYPYGLEYSDSWATDRDYIADLYGEYPDNEFDRDHNALIIWSGCLEKEPPIVVDTPVYSLDIVPTLSNLFGLDYDSRLLVGRDVLDEFSMPLVLWPDHSWITDKGRYDAYYDEFIPVNENITVTDEYIETVSDIVSDKISYSLQVPEYDYWGILFD